MPEKRVGLEFTIKLLAITFSVISLLISARSCSQSSQAIKISGEALEYTKKTQRPHLALTVTQTDIGDFVRVEEHNDRIEFRVRVKCKNIGSITASNIVERIIMTGVFNDKEYKNEPEVSTPHVFVSLPNRNISLPPDGELFFSDAIVIKDLKQGDRNTIFSAFHFEKLPITVELNIEYTDTSTLKRYSISAVYKIVKNNTEIIKYEDR